MPYDLTYDAIAVVYTHHHWPEGDAVTIGHPIHNWCATIALGEVELATKPQTPYLAHVTLRERNENAPRAFEPGGVSPGPLTDLIESLRPLTREESARWQQENGLMQVYDEPEISNCMGVGVVSGRGRLAA